MPLLKELIVFILM